MNPFDAPVSSAPFAGRGTELARMHQYLVAPQAAEALVYIGRRHSGKTALLWQFDQIFDAMSIGVHLPLTVAPLHDETAWLRALYHALHHALLMRGFSPERLPTPPDALGAVDAPAQAWRAWMTGAALPQMLHVIRAARRIALLLDDAHLLIEAIEAGRLPPDHPAWLYGLLQPQLRIILTVPQARAEGLDTLRPLVNPTTVIRLENLDAEAVNALLQAGGIVDTEVAGETLRATGGMPALLRLAAHQLWQVAQADSLTPDTTHAALLAVYSQSEPYFREMWDALSRSERLVLTAAAGLLYDDPLRPITAERVEAWLVETDYPLDLTAVQAAIRSLEYAQLVQSTASPAHPASITINGGLLHKWLVENTRLEPTNRPATLSRPPQTTASPAAHRHQALWMAVMLALLLFIALILALTSGGGTVIPDAPLQPTVTLSP